MQEMFLLKLGEVVLKGANRFTFETRLCKNIRRRMKHFGSFDVNLRQSTVYVTPLSEDCDVESAWEACHTLFGIAAVARAFPVEKTMDAIFDGVMTYLGDTLAAAKSFKVETKRADKSFGLNSIQISQEIGGRIAEAMPELLVDVHNPAFTVHIEIREHAAFIHGPSEPGAGGLPHGIGGRGAVLLSGGIDSPVAAYRMAKRGVELECIHFFSYPYTSERAKEKVLELARLITKYTGKMTVDIVGFTQVQEAIRDNCPEEYFTLIMRRFMMRIAQAIAKDHGCQCLITGENLGQVASQTMQAMVTTGAVIDLPLFTPLIGMDKEEIVRTARQIGTMETSILPYEDCCTVFTPKHPRTRPTLEEVEKAEAKLDVDALVADALQKVERVRVKYYED
ncbi:MAG: tRNA 4-thiouridine(8) synthase ThiI [Oscillospiraceae bacterium]|nr:tRNA 4-thiouridine(8) synthase ThiI [Oscillospiraceae bacterium]